MEKDIIINNINDYADYLGVNINQIERVIYKGTSCGAWIYWDNKGMVIGSIVEGSDAEFSKTFNFPVNINEINNWFEELEELTEEAWHEANEYWIY